MLRLHKSWYLPADRSLLPKRPTRPNTGKGLSYAKWRVFKGFQLCCSYEVAPEQKARTTYDNILRLVKDPEVCEPIRFLREREIAHYQRFGESLRIVQDHLDSKNFYAFNPEFDLRACFKNKN